MITKFSKKQGANSAEMCQMCKQPLRFLSSILRFHIEVPISIISIFSRSFVWKKVCPVSDIQNQEFFSSINFPIWSFLHQIFPIFFWMSLFELINLRNNSFASIAQECFSSNATMGMKNNMRHTLSELCSTQVVSYVSFLFLRLLCPLSNLGDMDQYTGFGAGGIFYHQFYLNNRSVFSNKKQLKNHSRQKRRMINSTSRRLVEEEGATDTHQESVDARGTFLSASHLRQAPNRLLIVTPLPFRAHTGDFRPSTPSRICDLEPEASNSKKLSGK